MSSYKSKFAKKIFNYITNTLKTWCKLINLGYETEHPFGTGVLDKIMLVERPDKCITATQLMKCTLKVTCSPQK